MTSELDNFNLYYHPVFGFQWLEISQQDDVEALRNLIKRKRPRIPPGLVYSTQKKKNYERI